METGKMCGAMLSRAAVSAARRSSPPDNAGGGQQKPVVIADQAPDHVRADQADKPDNA